MAMTFPIVLLCLLMGADPITVPKTPALERQRQQSVTAIAAAESKRLKVSVERDVSIPAVLHPEPLLRWSNATAGSIYGEVFFWSINDRPVAIASIYRWYDPFKDSTVEMVSVAESSVRVQEPNGFDWKSPLEGMKFEKLSNVPAPGDSRSSRLIQMREIVSGFSAILDDDRGGEVVTRELRLLNQPVHRYVSEKESVIDGALFAFVEGTDPEAWLIVEAVSEHDKSLWRYAMARMNAHPLRIRRGRETVADWLRIVHPPMDSKSRYTYFNFDPTQIGVTNLEHVDP